jgi:protein-S-isoprenylcysteine O-methyltransferase Ste14
MLTFSLVIVVIALANDAPPQAKLKAWHFWTGVGFLVASAWIRLWAAGHLVKNKVLTVTGPYAYVKNPLYIGTFLGMVGFTFLTWGDLKRPWYLAYANWIALAAGLLAFVLYYIPYKKKREGDRLHDIFGEPWDHYDKAVPDYFPKLTRYERAENRPWSWAATCENSEQWTPPAMVAGLAAILWNGWIIAQVERLIR